MGLKILHLIDSGGLYGAENMLLNLVEEQVKFGMDPLVLSAGDCGVPEKPLETEARRRGLPIKEIRIRKGLSPLTTLKLLRDIRRRGIDILHSHGYKFDINLGLIPARMRGAPVITTFHGHVPAEPFSRMAIYQWLDKLMVKGFECVVFVNEHMLEQPFFRGKVFKRTAIINNGINITREIERTNKQAGYCPDAEISRFIAGAKPLLGTISRLTQGKGIQDLICAFSQVVTCCPNARILIVGEGYYREQLEELIEAEGLAENVIITGYSDMVGYYMSALDLFVLPSHSEGLPMVLLEAMIAEKLILATRVGGIPEVLRQGRLGFLVRPGQCDEMAVMLLKLCDQIINGNDFCEIRQELRDEVRAHYSSEQMAAAYNRLYEDVLRGSAASM